VSDFRSDAEPFRVLAVCTGNVCRSPAVESGLRAALGVRSDVEVSSAGLRARVGDPVAPDMALLLDEPLPDFAARQATPDLIGGAGLVLAMTRAHRAAVVNAVPSAVRRTFTLAEFADFAVLARDAGVVPEGAPPGRRLAAVAAASPRWRGRRTPGRADDIEDPYGREPWHYARALAQIHDCLAVLVPVLVG
jgi:protein-tyrosine phosphatase